MNKNRKTHTLKKEYYNYLVKNHSQMIKGNCIGQSIVQATLATLAILGFLAPLTKETNQ